MPGFSDLEKGNLQFQFRMSEKAGHDLSEFYEGGLEKGGFSKLNLRKVRRRPGGGGGGRTLKA